MNRETENFLRRVRDAELGSPEDEERVLAAVRSATGAVPVTQVSRGSEGSEGSEGSHIDGSNALDVAGQGAAPTHQAAALGNAGQAAASGWFTKVGASLLFGGTLLGGAALIAQGFADAETSVLVSNRDVEHPASGFTAADILPERPIGEDVPLEAPEPLDAPGPLDAPKALDAPRALDDGARLRDEPPSGRRGSRSQQEELSAVSDAVADNEPVTGVSARSTSGAPPTSLAAELALLRRVQAALAAGDGATALRLLDEHDTTDSQLREERQVARILALCAAGNEQAARTAAGHFVRTHPKSVHHRSLKRSCAIP